jgi:uncharacterized membrane protein YkvA (DUF1232 family)
MTWGARLRDLAERFERELTALAYACRAARVALPARLVVLFVVVYILSPIDFIPESIHARLLGDFDDLVVLVVGFFVATRLVPAEVMADCRSRAVAHPLPALRWWIVVPLVLTWQFGSMLLISWWTGAPLLPTGQ